MYEGDSYEGSETENCEVVDNVSEETSDVQETVTESVFEEISDKNAISSEKENTTVTENTFAQSIERSEHPPNSLFETQEGRFRTDDKGNVHMYFDEESEKWRLTPDNLYEVNGYIYQTDEQGRIERVIGDVNTRDGGRKSLNASVEDMQENDQRGHVIADRLDGSNRVDNLVAMPAELNNGDYRALETKLAEAKQAGHDVQVDIDISYDDESRRPNGVIVAYSIDGNEEAVMFEYADYEGKE